MFASTNKTAVSVGRGGVTLCGGGGGHLQGFSSGITGQAWQLSCFLTESQQTSQLSIFNIWDNNCLLSIGRRYTAEQSRHSIASVLTRTGSVY